MKTFFSVRAGGTYNYHCAERATPCLPLCLPVATHVREGVRGLQEMATVYRYEIQESRYPAIVIETDTSLPEEGDAPLE
jgi:hypothetical protein